MALRLLGDAQAVRHFIGMGYNTDIGGINYWFVYYFILAHFAALHVLLMNS